MADIQMTGRGFAPQAGSYQDYQPYQPSGFVAERTSHTHDPEPQQPPQARRSAGVNAANLVGAGMSLALLVGIGVWGYQLIARDVAGVPVVRAMQGEMRVRPDEPGGRQALNQGLAVNEVAAAGATAGPSERIVLAPQPIDLSNETVPLIDQLANATPRYASADPAPAAAQGSQTVSLTAPKPAGQLTSIQQLADQIAAGATPLTSQGAVKTPAVRVSVSDVPTAPAPQTTRVSAMAADGSGLAASPRPRIRPAGGVRVASLNAAAPATNGFRDVDAASIPVGTRLVQLGAYDSPEVARSEWTRFSQRFDEYMTGKDRVIQRAVSGGRTFYRLRAMGFADLNDARQFCSALTAQNIDCIPVVTR